MQQTFPLAQCFVFQNADGKGAHKAVLFELNCSNLQGNCSQNIIADLGNDFVFQNSDNPGFKLLSSTIGGYVGVLKGELGVPRMGPARRTRDHPLKFPCNQISGFTLSGDPLGGTTQKSKPGTSCWTIVYGGDRRAATGDHDHFSDGPLPTHRALHRPHAPGVVYLQDSSDVQDPAER